MKIKILWIAFMLLSFVSCQNSKTHNIKKENSSLYEQAILSSMSPCSEKIYNNLVAINKQNENLVWKFVDGEEYILVVAWEKDTSSYKTNNNAKFYNTGNHLIWVTVVPELFQRMKQENYEDENLRLKQLLGLPPNSVNQYFIEFWVKPQDLFRPCPDSEVTDKQCDLCFPENESSKYISLINNLRIEKYYQCELYKKYPWTQLGYTYDWSFENKSHIGLSEFVIAMGKNIIIKEFYSTKNYLNEVVYKKHLN